MGTGSGSRIRHDVRLIGGQWKRSRLPVAERPGLRPTPDRVRETLFNWLGQDLRGWRCLDAFAGSGALGFEAASRGAAEAVLLERDPMLVRSLCSSRQRLAAESVHVVQCDALAWMRQCTPARFELIFLDPPYDAALLEPALRLAVALLSEDGFVYVESGQLLPGLPDGLSPYRAGKAGAVHHGLWRRGYTRADVRLGPAP